MKSLVKLCNHCLGLGLGFGYSFRSKMRKTWPKVDIGENAFNVAAASSLALLVYICIYY